MKKLFTLCSAFLLFASANAAPEKKIGAELSPEFAEKVVKAYAELSPSAKAAVNEEARKLLEEFRKLPPEEQSAVILELQSLTRVLLKAAQDKTSLDTQPSQ